MESEGTQALLLALQDAAARFPFRCLRLHNIVAQTKHNVVVRLSIGVSSGEKDYVLKTSLRPEESYPLQQVWANEAQNDLKKELAEFVLPMELIWGHGLGGIPTYLRLQPYVHGRTLREWSLRQLMHEDEKLLPQLSLLCSRILARFVRTGVILDISGSWFEGYSGIRRVCKNLWLNFSFYNTTNVMIEDKTNRVLVVDTDAPRAFLSLGYPNLKMKAKILVMFLGVFLSKLVFDICIMFRETSRKTRFGQRS